MSAGSRALLKCFTTCRQNFRHRIIYFSRVKPAPSSVHVFSIYTSSPFYESHYTQLCDDIKGTYVTGRT